MPWKEHFVCLFAQESRKTAHWHWLGLFCSQLQQPPCTVTQRGAPTHFPLSHPSSKRIAPTDNTQPKSDDTKKCHWWLKGLYQNFIIYSSTLDCYQALPHCALNFCRFTISIAPNHFLIILCPAHMHFPARNSLVNEIKFLGPTPKKW